MPDDEYEIHTGKVSASPYFGWRAYMLHVPTDTIVDTTYGPDETTVCNLMRRRRFERTRPPATTVSFYGSGTVHLAFVDPERDTVPFRPFNGETGEVDRDGNHEQRAINRSFDGTALCGVPLTQHTVLTDARTNCTPCLRRLDHLRDQGAVT